MTEELMAESITEKTRDGAFAASSAGEERATQSAGHRRTILRVVDRVSLVAFLVVLIVVFSLMSPQFFTIDNFGVILSNAAVIGIVCVGQTFVIISGGFDLSVGGVIPLTSVAFAMAANAGIPLPVVLVLVLIGAALFGVGNGLLVSKAHISPLIATLATTSIAGGLAFSISQGLSVPFKDPATGVLADRGLFGIPNQIFLFVLVVIVAAIVLRFTIYGRSVYAIGGNGEASRLAGMRVDLMLVSVYALSGMLAGLGGVVLSSQLLSGSGSIGTDSALTSIAAVVLGGAALTGGVGTVWGTVFGVLILGVLSNGLALLQVSSFYQTIATGCVLLLAVGFGRLTSRSSRK